MLIFVQYHLHLNKIKKEKKMKDKRAKHKKEIKDLEIELFEKKDETKELMIKAVKGLKKALLQEKD